MHSLRVTLFIVFINRWLRATELQHFHFSLKVAGFIIAEILRVLVV